MDEFIDIHFNGQLELYLSKVIKREDYNIFLSDIIDDTYWNLAYLKTGYLNLDKAWKEIKTEMINSNRKPLIYITSLINNNEIKKALSKNNLELLYTDVWMTIENLEQFKECSSDINFDINIVNERLQDKFIQAIMDGFSGDNPDDPYESLSDGYRTALEENIKRNNSSNYKSIHYLGLKDKENITTATVIYKNDKAVIYNVTTNKKYQKHGACKKMMSYIINDLKNKGIKEVCLQTEKGFYTEEVYKSMGFKGKMLGQAYVEKEQSI